MFTETILCIFFALLLFLIEVLILVFDFHTIRDKDLKLKEKIGNILISIPPFFLIWLFLSFLFKNLNF